MAPERDGYHRGDCGDRQKRKIRESDFFIIGRTAGEDKDYANEAGSYLLTPEELENLKVLTAHFEQVAVLFERVEYHRYELA